MFKKKIKLIHLSLILLVLLSASFAFPQFEPGSNSKPTTQLLDEEGFPAPNSIFEPIPPAYWIKFTSFKTVSIIIILLAFLLGLVSYYIGHSAGGDINKKEIRKSVISALTIAIIARPISIMAHKYLGLGLDYFLPEAYAYGIAGLIVYVLWMAYVLAIPVYLYESFTVTAKEAYPVGGRR